MIINRNSCYYCGEPTEDDVQIGPNVTVYCCDKKECQRELRSDQREAYYEAREEHEQRFDDYWNGY